MIFVDRDSRDENGMPIRPSDDWFASAAKATISAIAQAEKHKPNAAIYAHPEVRKSLEKLFRNKCAYCEWIPTGGSDWDVEHFRPKGRVAEARNHPGYYWLTYDWKNLYLACTHCNQKRKDKPLWAKPDELPSGGKMDQFPLEDESTRVTTHHGDISNEITLLLDPCFEDPADYLGFDVRGRIFAIQDNLYGAASIDVFHLERRRLEDLRQKTINLTIVALTALNRAKANNQIDAVEDFRKLIDEFQSGSSQFAGAARYVEKDPEAFGLDPEV